MRSGDVGMASFVSSKYPLLIRGIEALYPDFFSKGTNSDLLEEVENMRCLLFVIKSQNLFKSGSFVGSIQMAGSCFSTLSQVNRKDLLLKLLQKNWDQLHQLEEKKDLIGQALHIAHVDSLVLALYTIGVQPSELPCPDNATNTSCTQFSQTLEFSRNKLIGTLEEQGKLDHKKGEYNKGLTFLDHAIRICAESQKERLTQVRAELFQSAVNQLEQRKINYIDKNDWLQAKQTATKIAEIDPSYPVELEIQKIECIEYRQKGQVEYENANWLQALENWKYEEEMNCNKLICAGCPNPTELANRLTNVHRLLEDQMNTFLQQKDLESALSLADQVSAVDKDYSLEGKKNRLRAIYFFEKGKEALNNSDADNALILLEKAETARAKAVECTGCPSLLDIDAALQKARYWKAMKMLEAAEENYNGGDYVSAVLLIDSAQSLLPSIPERYNAIRKDAMTKAKKKLAVIVVQSDPSGAFNSSNMGSLATSVKIEIENALRANNYYGKFIDVVFNQGLYQSNTDIIRVARNAQADYALVVDLSNVYYQFFPDYSPEVYGYCKKERIIRWTSPTNYFYKDVLKEGVSVEAYTDVAIARANFKTYILHVKNRKSP
ncbi:MAG: hypothetical protein IPJ40_07700 [Saprospirales bacterium]|nr:hypothetical protein [Saprospirales bacterium]